MYKIKEDNTILRKSDGAWIPKSTGNRDYQQFVTDIYEQGTGIVEGADIQTEIPYTAARVVEYPPIKDQLDKIYHSGIDAWKADIKIIKDKYPKTQVGITTTEALPSWVDKAIFDKQKQKYLEAKERLTQYELSAGKFDEDRYMTIPPLPISIIDSRGETIRNPLVVQDEAEREDAQKIIDMTPQAVIDSINT